MEEPKQPAWVTKIADTHMFIGMVAAEWNKMEYAMGFLAAHLIGTTHEIARITLYAMNPPARRDYLYAIILQRQLGDTEIGKKLTSYVDEFERLRKLRNDMVHGRWDFSIDHKTDVAKPMLTVNRGRSAPKEVTTQEDTQNVIKVVNAIQALNASTFALTSVLEAVMRR